MKTSLVIGIIIGLVVMYRIYKLSPKGKKNSIISQILAEQFLDNYGMFASRREDYKNLSLEELKKELKEILNKKNNTAHRASQ